MEAVKTFQCVKCVCVGDGAVGKTCMLTSKTTDSFPTEYVPTVFEVSPPDTSLLFSNRYRANAMVDGRQISLRLWDTDGKEEGDGLRALVYANVDVDVFIVCYSITSPTSLENIERKWLPEIRRHCPNSPFLLVGTKCDLREDARALEKLKANGASFVNLARAEKKGKELAAARVMECSAKTQVGLKDVFDEAIKVALAARAKPAKKKGNCMLL